jgi:hypothetical protein
MTSWDTYTDTVDGVAFWESCLTGIEYGLGSKTKLNILVNGGKRPSPIVICAGNWWGNMMGGLGDHLILQLLLILTDECGVVGIGHLKLGLTF